MKEDYRILGLEPGADPNEMKKAYFRQLRKHSPEKDPEGFQKLRAAYERLQKQEPEEEVPVFPPFQTKIEEYFAQQIENCKRNGDWALQRDTAEEACRHFPGNVYFLYQLVIAQRETGNTGKAVKNAQLLVKNDPENRWYQRELAMAYAKRGFHTKAWPVFEKAYGMGCRDMDFLWVYANECMETGETDRLPSLLKRYVHTERELDKKEIARVRHSLDILVSACNMGWGEGKWDFQEEFDLVCRLIEKYPSLIREEMEDWAATLDYAIYLIKPGNGNAIKAEKAFSLLRAQASDKDTIADVEERRKNCIWKLFDEDSRIGRAIRLMMDAAEETGSVVGKFSRTDSMLCMIREREEVLAQLPVLEKEYPSFYSIVEPYTSQLKQDEITIAQLKDRLMTEMRAALEKYSINSVYMDWFPEEKEKVFGKKLSTGEETYRRRNKKIGRNDPCPCGSGKKFKQCCINKGIYD